MRASSSLRLAALTLAVAFAGGSLASAQCPNCGPGGFGYGYGHHNYRIGDYGRYGGGGPGGFGHGGGLHSGGVGPGDCVYRQYGTDLFHQYYIGNNCGGAPAAMYPAPNTTIPPFVGHVYYTYEPLYPHEYLYPHHRTYHRYYNDGRGLTRTHVSWKASHTLSALKVIPFSLIP
jgi:hypothetical protein